MTEIALRIPDIPDAFECSVWLVLATPDVDESGFDGQAWIAGGWNRLVSAVPGLPLYGAPMWNNAHCHLSFYRFANHGETGVAMLRQLVVAFPKTFPDGYGVIHFRRAETDGEPFSRIVVGLQARDV